MPLYRVKNQDSDNTYLFDSQPAEDYFELVPDETPVVTDPETDEES